MLSTPTSDHVRGDIQGHLDRTLHVELVSAVKVLLLVVGLLVVHPEPQRIQEDPVGLAALLDW